MSELSGIGREMPHSLDAEQALLGAMLIDPSIIDSVINSLKKEDFYYRQNGEIYDTMKYLHQVNSIIDIITVGEELKKRDSYETVGGAKYLAELSNNVASSKSIKAYVKIIEERAILRALINAGNDIAEKSFDAKDEIQNIIDYAEKQIFNINQNRRSNDFTPVLNVMMEVLNQLEAKASTKSHITGIDTGFSGINRMTAGLQRSDLILLAARPAMGKTAFALNVAGNAAKVGHSVALFSLEMSKEQYIQRLISSEALIELSKLRIGDFTDDEWQKIIDVMSMISKYKIYIDDTPAITLFDLISKCRRLKIEQGLDLIVIDYLQLMSYGGKSESRQQEISSISRGLKQLAREVNCPVVALSQLSRAVEQRPDHRPVLSDLRESGAIEQDADIVMMLYRDEYYNKEESEKKGRAEVIIAKHRNGSIGTVELVFVDRFTKFSDMPREMNG